MDGRCGRCFGFMQKENEKIFTCSYRNAQRVLNKSIIKISSLVKNCLAGYVCDSVW